MEKCRYLRFGGWTLDRSAGELLRGDTRVRLQGQPLQVLEALLARPGELLTREELITLLWPKGVVEYDTALNSTVRRLRAALQDDADEPRCIETIPRRGYRLIAVVEPVPPAAPAPPYAAAAPAQARQHRQEPAKWRGAALVAMLLAAGVGFAKLSLQQGEQPPLPALGQANPEAVDLTRRARHLLQRREPGDLALATGHFIRAVDAEPSYAEAWAGLASAYWLSTVTGELPPEQGLARVRDAAERALSIDPGLAEPHVRLALYRSHTGELAQRAGHLHRAFELEPENPLVLSMLASHEAETGNFEEALQLQQKALAAEPLSLSARFNLAWLFYISGQFEKATTTLDELRELNPASTLTAELAGTLMVIQGRFAEALEAARESDAEDQLFISALALHSLGRHDEAERAAAALAEISGSNDPLRLAEMWAWLGRHDAAFAQLALALTKPRLPPWQRTSRQPWMMRHSPLLRPIHADPRWEAWLESD